MAANKQEPPLLVALEIERARSLATARGWEVRVLTTSPLTRPPMGPRRVIRQTAPARGVLELVVAGTTRLAVPPLARRFK